MTWFAALMHSAWREHLLARVTVLESAAEAIPDEAPRVRYKTLAKDVLATARNAATRKGTLMAGWTGADVEEAWVSTHAAEVAIVRGSTLEQVTAAFPSLVEDCLAILPKDPRVLALKKLVDGEKPIDAKHHVLMADTLQSVYATSDAQHMQVRSFRNILLATTFLLGGLVVLVGIIGWRSPGVFALCSPGRTPICPTGVHKASGGDVALVELLGLLAASITGATSIRKLSGTSTPYGVPIVSLALKLPIGALTALGGLVFLRAGFGPTIKSLNQVQICAYALVFGASQQLFMQFVDKQAKTVLDAATTPGDKTNSS